MATMDFDLKIESSTSGTVTLTSSPFEIKQYHSRYDDPETPTISETCNIRLKDGSVAANLDELRTLRKLCKQAKDAQVDANLGRVYLTFTEASGGTAYRSELKQAVTPWDLSTLDYPHWTGDTQFATMSWERANYWEGPEAQLALTNPNGTANTSGLRVYNCNDGTVVDSTYYQHNYVDVAGTAIAGELPSPTRLEMTNLHTETGDYKLAYLWIGQNWTNPSTFTHYYEFVAGTAVADGDMGGGYFQQIGLNSGSEADIDTWTISAAQMAAAAGKYYKFIIHTWTAAPIVHTSLRYRVRLEYNSWPIWESGYLSLDSSFGTSIRDLLAFKLPPWLNGLSNLGALDLVLRGYQASGVHKTVHLDYMQLLPLDGFRYIQAISTAGAGTNERIVDDGIERYTYQDDGSGSDKRGFYATTGRAIHLYPGKNQRLYFMMHSTLLNESKVSRKISVKLYYRPRRLSL